MWQHPFPKSTITSRFGEMKPPRTSPHRGTDYAPGAKELIPAVTDGKVTRIFYSDCLGWICEIKSDEHGLYIGHSHLYCNKHDSIDCDGTDHEDGSTCMKSLRVGDRVKIGDWVGRVGDSGTCSRGAHLHISVSKQSDPRYAKVFDLEKFIDAKIKKQERTAAAKARTRAVKAKLPKPTLKPSKRNTRPQATIPKTGAICKCCNRPL